MLVTLDVTSTSCRNICSIFIFLFLDEEPCYSHLPIVYMCEILSTTVNINEVEGRDIWMQREETKDENWEQKTRLL